MNTSTNILDEIQNGIRLKPTKTVDKSAPVIHVEGEQIKPFASPTSAEAGSKQSNGLLTSTPKGTTSPKLSPNGIPVAPPPPPPPMGLLSHSATSSAKPDDRKRLLGEIERGVTLKKAVTNDKSAPVVNNSGLNTSLDTSVATISSLKSFSSGHSPIGGEILKELSSSKLFQNSALASDEKSLSTSPLHSPGIKSNTNSTSALPDSTKSTKSPMPNNDPGTFDLTNTEQETAQKNTASVLLKAINVTQTNDCKTANLGVQSYHKDYVEELRPGNGATCYSGFVNDSELNDPVDYSNREKTHNGVSCTITAINKPVKISNYLNACNISNLNTQASPGNGDIKELKTSNLVKMAKENFEAEGQTNPAAFVSKNKENFKVSDDKKFIHGKTKSSSINPQDTPCSNNSVKIAAEAQKMAPGAAKEINRFLPSVKQLQKSFENDSASQTAPNSNPSKADNHSKMALKQYETTPENDLEPKPAFDNTPKTNTPSSKCKYLPDVRRIKDQFEGNISTNTLNKSKERRRSSHSGSTDGNYTILRNRIVSDDEVGQPFNKTAISTATLKLSPPHLSDNSDKERKRSLQTFPNVSQKAPWIVRQSDVSQRVMDFPIVSELQALHERKLEKDNMKKCRSASAIPLESSKALNNDQTSVCRPSLAEFNQMDLESLRKNFQFTIDVNNADPQQIIHIEER